MTACIQAIVGRAHAVCAYLVVGSGLLHIALTGHTYGEWLSPRALFFLGCGVCIVLLGFMNLVLLRAGGDPRVRSLCRSCHQEERGGG